MQTYNRGQIGIHEVVKGLRNVLDLLIVNTLKPFLCKNEESKSNTHQICTVQILCQHLMQYAQN